MVARGDRGRRQKGPLPGSAGWRHPLPQSTRQGWARRGALEKGGEAEARPGARASLGGGGGRPGWREGVPGARRGRLAERRRAMCSGSRGPVLHLLEGRSQRVGGPGPRRLARYREVQAVEEVGEQVVDGPVLRGPDKARVGEDRAAAVVQEVTERRREGRLERRLEGPGALCPVAGRSPATARRPGRLSAGGPGCVAWCSCPHTSPDGRRVGSGARAVVPVRRDPPPGAWRGGARLLRRLRQEVERADMRGADDQEVAPIESGNLGRAESLCNGYDRRVDRPKWQVRVLGDERRRPP